MKITRRAAVYHCMTRSVNKEMLFGDVAKEMLRRMIWQVAEFSEVEVLSYCVMSNHFHVLVRMPDGREVAVSDEELLRRYQVYLYCKGVTEAPGKGEGAASLTETDWRREMERGGGRYLCLRRCGAGCVILLTERLSGRRNSCRMFSGSTVESSASGERRARGR